MSNADYLHTLPVAISFVVGSFEGVENPSCGTLCLTLRTSPDAMVTEMRRKFRRGVYSRFTRLSTVYIYNNSPLEEST